MQNTSLVRDYVVRASHRIAAVEVLFERQSWADVVRESQEAIELTLKALLRASRVEVPRIHDVSQVLLLNAKAVPPSLKTHIEKLARISKSLRRDRELAFYGSEDLTPSEFYEKSDAEEALTNARWVVKVVAEGLGIPIH